VLFVGGETISLPFELAKNSVLIKLNGSIYVNSKKHLNTQQPQALQPMRWLICLKNEQANAPSFLRV
jgi:hypothetical protein